MLFYDCRQTELHIGAGKNRHLRLGSNRFLSVVLRRHAEHPPRGIKGGNPEDTMLLSRSYSCEAAVLIVRKHGKGLKMKTYRLVAFMIAWFILSLIWITPLTAGNVSQRSTLRGKTIYEKHCAACHGTDGRADTPIGRLLRPRPRDFADPIIMARLDDSQMIAAIELGRAGTAMPSWREILSPADMFDVVHYIRSLQQPLPAGITRAKLDILVGEHVYRKYCSVCHGDKGNGHTPLGRGLFPHPKDFTSMGMAGISDKQLMFVVEYGKPGSAMAPWGSRLSPEDIRRVVLYIRQTFERHDIK